MERASASTSSRPRLTFLRIFIVTLTALVPVLVLASHVYSDFQRVRQRVVRTPLVASDGPISIAVPEVSELGGEPVALIAHVRNETSQSLRLAIDVDGAKIATTSLAPGASRRIDASAFWHTGAHTLTFTGDRPEWTLQSLEIANVHGHSTAPLELQVVPRTRRTASPSAGVLIAVFAGLVAMGLWATPPGRRWRRLRRTAAGIGLALCGLTLLAPWWTPFGILLSVQTFVLVVALIHAHPIAQLARAISGWMVLAGRRAKASVKIQPVLAAAIDVGRAARPVLPHLVIVLAMLYGVAQFWSPGVGLTKLVAFGDRFAYRTSRTLQSVPHVIDRESWGYDGQFYAQLAFDPFLRDPDTMKALDVPAYRGRRMLFPLVAYVAGLGQPVWVLHAYTVLNIVCWVSFAVLLWVWLPPGSPRMFAAWLGCLLGNGWIASLRLSLTDGPSMFLIALAVFAIDRARANSSAGVLAAAALGRETSVINAVMLLPRRVREIRVAHLLRIAAVVVPLGLWMFYLRSLGLTYIGAEANLSAPFLAMIDKWQTTLSDLRVHGWAPGVGLSLIAIVGMTVQALYIALRWRWTSAWWRIGAVHAMFMLILGAAVWEGAPGAATRVLLPLAVAFNIELVRAGRAFWPLWILGNLSMATSSQFLPIPYLASLI